jgi:curved DNA-binding protein CbpA
MSLSVNDYIKYDLYQLFLLNKNNFTISALRKAYQRQILIYHPDKFEPNLSEEEQKEKMDLFLLINNAYTILSTDLSREQYDEKRELFLTEEKGFTNLKSQFLADKKKYTVPAKDLDAEKQKAELEFKKSMEQMNQELEKQAISIQEKELNIKELDKQELNKNVNDYLIPTSVKPDNNFNDELTNITTNRNMKIENDGTKLYEGLDSSRGITEKYAFIDEVFK